MSQLHRGRFCGRLNQAFGYMMTFDISKELRFSLLMSICTQIVLGAIAGITLDGGMFMQVWIFSTIAFWSGCVVVLARRWKRHTKADLVLVRWGFLILCFGVTPAFSRLICGFCVERQDIESNSEQRHQLGRAKATLRSAFARRYGER